jgi:hypothetical protein
MAHTSEHRSDFSALNSCDVFQEVVFHD